jgi:hypothetical protein
MMFTTGYWLARHGGYHPWRTGASVVVLGSFWWGWRSRSPDEHQVSRCGPAASSPAVRVRTGAGIHEYARFARGIQQTGYVDVCHLFHSRLIEFAYSPGARA